MKLLKGLGLLFIGFISSCADDPVPCFEAEVEDEYTYTMRFNNCSDLASSYTWDFGDGSATSTENNPVHTYDEPGQYEVTLSAMNERRDASITKTIEVPSAITIDITPSSNSAKEGQMISFDANVSTINGIEYFSCTHYFSNMRRDLLDSTLADNPTEANFEITRRMPRVYRDASYFEFVVKDANEEVKSLALSISSEDNYDSTSGRILTDLRNDKDPFEFTYSHGYALHNKTDRSLEKINLYLYDSDGDYIFIENVVVQTGSIKRFKATVHDDQNGVTHIKEQQRSAADDAFYIDELNEKQQFVSGGADIALNLESEFFDVLKIDFKEITIGVVLE